jgi:hypothetical protein
MPIVATDSPLAVLTDDDWAALKGALDAARSPRPQLMEDWRQTVEAVTGRFENGAKWRAIPPEFGRLTSTSGSLASAAGAFLCAAYRSRATRSRTTGRWSESRSGDGAMGTVTCAEPGTISGRMPSLSSLKVEAPAFRRAASS